MIRIEVSLTEEERRALDAASPRTGRSLSALIHDADRLELTSTPPSWGYQLRPGWCR